MTQDREGSAGLRFRSLRQFVLFHTGLRLQQDLGKDAKIFTAHLDLSYRRPLKSNAEYLVEVCVDRVERKKKLYCRISDMI